MRIKMFGKNLPIVIICLFIYSKKQKNSDSSKSNFMVKMFFLKNNKNRSQNLVLKL